MMLYMQSCNKENDDDDDDTMGPLNYKCPVKQEITLNMRLSTTF